MKRQRILLMRVLLPYGFLLGEIEKNENSFSIKPLKKRFFCR